MMKMFQSHWWQSESGTLLSYWWVNGENFWQKTQSHVFNVSGSLRTKKSHRYTVYGQSEHLFKHFYVFSIDLNFHNSQELVIIYMHLIINLRATTILFGLMYDGVDRGIVSQVLECWACNGINPDFGHSARCEYKALTAIVALKHLHGKGAGTTKLSENRWTDIRYIMLNDMSSFALR